MLDAEINAMRAHVRAGMSPEDEWEEYIEKRAEKRVGLQLYPELGLAVQPVSGVMWAGAPKEYEAFYRVFNTERIGRAVAQVQADPSIKRMVFRFNTPGGYVTGVPEAASMIAGLPQRRKDMAVAGYIEGMCCSAGTWVSAAVPVLKSAPSATVGSVGVYNAVWDTSRAYQEAGVEPVLAVDGKYKAMGFPGVPVSDDQRAWLKAGVMETSAEFKGWMRERRPEISDDSMEGQTFQARRAPAGFHDGTEFDHFDQFLAALLGL